MKKKMFVLLLVLTILTNLGSVAMADAIPPEPIRECTPYVIAPEPIREFIPYVIAPEPIRE